MMVKILSWGLREQFKKARPLARRSINQPAIAVTENSLELPA